ncbi:TetR/AcrR family transcriptional regulator [Microvirga massiliensis]|uniref:TetR/AcrR family transcriptional regulator n=1 Tax=Microvirga massiliensis TaxID=1033741 RepID=UPI0006997FE0|nr:TetR/AcrR family transcriptional regulator [Microvirga massiliensis]
MDARAKSTRRTPDDGIRRRNPDRTKQSILTAATAEFCRHGFDGARVNTISSRSNTNIRLLYQYFGDKAGLYLAVLEHVYAEIRAAEQRLQLDEVDPVEGMRRLVDFTFSFFGSHHEYVSLINNENMLRAQHIKKSNKIKSLTLPLVTAIKSLLARGEKSGVFRKGIDPVQLYISIVAQSYFHVSNRFTLSAMFDKDLTDESWLTERRRHAQELILTWLTADPEHDRSLMSPSTSDAQHWRPAAEQAKQSA